jgi:4-amino-4-deoxy-L-arabinose transferase-like glycosyltransferase
MMATGYRKRVTFLLFTLLLVRFWLGQTFELTPAEAYTWLKGSHLDWGYWDQGPLVPFLSWLGTLFFGPTELGVRWIAAVIYSASGFLLFLTTRQWFSARAGFYAVILFIVMPLYVWQTLLLTEATVSVGLMALALLVYRHVVERGRWDDWLLAGLVSAAAVTVSWWNILWPAGLLLFRSLDHQRTGRWLTQQTVAFIGICLLGFVPFLAWHLHIGYLTGLPESAVHWMAGKAHLGRSNPVGLVLFLWQQAVWLGFGCLVALGFIVLRARDYAFLNRPHLFLLCLGLPGLIFQAFASCFHAANPDMLAALYLPLLSLAGSVGTRVTDADRRWRLAALAVIIVAGVQSVSGLLPRTAKFWANYSPARGDRHRAVAVEIARLQHDSGGSFLIVQDPLDAAVFAFYLPLQPFVYVVPHRAVETQFDLWPGYQDFETTNALYVGDGGPLPHEIETGFQNVRPLPGIPIPEAQRFHFYLCERFGATKSATEP